MAKPKSPSTDLVETPTAVEPKIRYKDQIQIDHHLFKGKVAVALKRDKFGPIPIKRIEHVHYFHTVNSQGQPQRHCAAVAGHIHEWSWSINPLSGELEAKCGPPLKKTQKISKNGTSKVVYEQITMGDDEGNRHTDSHTHDMEYIASQRLTQAMVRDIQKSNQQLTGSPDVKIHSDPKQPEGYEVSSADSKRQLE